MLYMRHTRRDRAAALSSKISPRGVMERTLVEGIAGTLVLPPV